MKKNYKYLGVILSVVIAIFVFTCNRSANLENPVDRAEAPNGFDWKKGYSIVAFTFDPRKKNNIDLGTHGGDPWKLLNKKFFIPEDTFDLIILDEKRVAFLFDELHRGITDEELERDAQRRQPKDCGFNPRHGFVFIDKKGLVKAYAAVCFECAQARSYGKTYIALGTLERLYRFCQFNGLRYGLENPDALQTFGTDAERKCWTLRKHSGEEIGCD